MNTSVKMKIMITAARIRYRKGMPVEEILLLWPRLKAEEQEQIRKALA